jgi:hypothetical protein
MTLDNFWDDSGVSGSTYTQSQIDAFFEGETAGGKKQVDWDSILNKPSGTDPIDASDIVSGVIQAGARLGTGTGGFLKFSSTVPTWSTIATGDLPTGISATNIANGTISNTEFQYLNGVTSAIQTQLNGKASSTHNHDSDYLGISAKAADSTLFNGSADTNFVKTNVSGTYLMLATLQTGGAFEAVDGSGVARLNANGSGGYLELVDTTGATKFLMRGYVSSGVQGVMMAGDLHFYDDLGIRLGTNSDFRQYFNGANTVLETAAGNINLRYGASSILASFKPGGAAELYYNGAKKLETTNTGATITGNLILTGYMNAAYIATGVVSNTEFNYLNGVTSAIQTQLNGKATSTHTHGNITNAGAVGSTANLPLITGTSGVVQTGTFGTAANTFCQGNDYRLSDARTPTAHTHGNISDTGKIGSTANLPLITGSTGTVTVGSFGTAPYTFCQGNDSRLSNVRKPDLNGTLIDNGDNLNSLAANNRIYKWASSTPSNAPDDYGICLDIADGGQQQQLVLTHGGSANKVSLYGRRKTSGTWDTVWTQYYSDHYHPTADDATTLGGYSPNILGVGNTIALRNSSGEITAEHFIMQDTQAQRDSDTVFYTGSVGRMYSNTATGFRTCLGVLSTSEVESLFESVGALPRKGYINWSYVTSKPSTFTPSSHGHDATDIANGTISNTEFQYLNGVTSAIQTQLNGKLALTGGTLTGDLVVGAATGGTRSVKVLAGDAYKAGFEAYGNSQSTGYVYVGQSAAYGGGILYNGDDSPDLPNTTDTISFYRRTAGVDYEVFYYSHSSNNVVFHGNISLAGTVDGVDIAAFYSAYNSHTHGNISRAGAIGSTANLPLITGTSGVVTVSSFGTGANTFCQGNDSRLSDARTPLAHNHSAVNITSGTIAAGARLGTGSSGFLKYAAGTPTWSAIAAGDLPSSIDSAKIANGTISNTEFQYLNGVTSAIQTQLNGKLALTGGTLTGNLLMTTGKWIGWESGQHWITNNDGFGNFNLRHNNYISGGELFSVDGRACHFEFSETATDSWNLQIRATDPGVADDNLNTVSSAYFEFYSPAATRSGGFNINNGGLFTSGTLRVTSAGALTNVTAPATILTSGTISAGARLGTGSSGFLKYASGTPSWSAIAAGDLPSAIDSAKIANGTVSNTEFQYLNGVTSAIQTQLNGKAASSHNHSATNITSGTIAAGARLGSGSSGFLKYAAGTPTWSAIAAGDLPSAIDATKIANGTISNTEFQYLNGAIYNIPTAMRILARLNYMSTAGNYIVTDYSNPPSSPYRSTAYNIDSYVGYLDNGKSTDYWSQMAIRFSLSNRLHFQTSAAFFVKEAILHLDVSAVGNPLNIYIYRIDNAGSAEVFGDGSPITQYMSGTGMKHVDVTTLVQAMFDNMSDTELRTGYMGFLLRPNTSTVGQWTYIDYSDCRLEITWSEMI